ncbi:S-adenosyl-L-methionine-dependent methyltransferase [Chaetomium strumarium]|uniref:S-adenosyl-L-methionine-dependent methyltransferase n=1 Tax=Chaetomium strumarium TaxID=1170767 RepID=A0AAJ0GKN2_9PEZI|nr:S-adenosyl-L-methionine-dependent methyltransferase [Chaetomium strumarium]
MSASIPTPIPPPDVKDRLKESYNAIAEAYMNWSAGRHNHLRFNYTAELLKLLRRDRLHPTTAGGDSSPPQDGGDVSLGGLRALELGCGCGVPVIGTLLARGFEVLGVDLSSTQVQMATRKYFPDEVQNGQLVVVEKDMMELTYPPGEFDVVVALYSLIHLPRNEQRVMMERVHRWLKPGGMILMNYSVEELEGEVIEKWLGQEKGWVYWSAWGKDKMLDMLDELEFKVLLQEVKGDEGTDASFLWVIAQKENGNC